jgi:hypothetical protein
LYVQNPDPVLLDRFMKSFEYWSKWHLENRRPAFVPWHTQAYFQVWQVTRDEKLRDFIFEMNDWLLSMQQWEDVAYDDERGRFFDRKRPEFGPPHASSTGVYIEGLIDAWQLAVAVGDKTRAESYRRALARGLRDLMQLQFVDDDDLFYVTDPEMTRGGVRTTVFRSEIRVDNVQHGLMGLLKILDLFGPDQYGTE